MNRSTFGRDLIILILLICLGVGVYDHFRKRSAAPVVPTTFVLPNTKAVEVDSIKPAQLTSNPADQAQIAALLKEVAQLKAKPVIATVTTAESHSTGKLDVVTSPHPSTDPTVIEVPTTVEVPTFRDFTAKDYRLTITGTAEGKIDYELRQKFLALSVTGRSKDGKRLTDVQLFEVTPTGNVRLPAQTAEAYVDETTPHWLTGFNLQGGIRPGPKSAVIGLQWLKHGRSNNPGDLKYALLTPVVTFGSGGADVGLLPISFNVANFIPHQPTTNVWASPYVGYAERKLGFVVSVTF